MRRRRVIAATAAGILLAPLATATPLCRDGKGLFTPCPQSANRTARAILIHAPAHETESLTARTAPATVHPVHIAGTARKPRLCTDSKGLFTPCAR